METKTKLHGQIKVNETTLNYDLKDLKLNVECVLREGDYSGMNHEDKGHSFGYQLTQSQHPNFINLKIAIDEFLLSEINCRGLN